jgi:hypothetical protein
VRPLNADCVKDRHDIANPIGQRVGCRIVWLIVLTVASRIQQDRAV